MFVTDFGQVEDPCADCFEDPRTGAFHCSMNCSPRRCIHPNTPAARIFAEAELYRAIDTLSKD